MKLSWRFLKDNQKHLDKAPVAAEWIDWVIDKGLQFFVPVTPILKAGVRHSQNWTIQLTWLRMLSGCRNNQQTTMLLGQWWRLRLQKWKMLNKPKNMVVNLAHGLSSDEESNIRSVFTDNGAKDLLFGSGWTVVL